MPSENDARPVAVINGAAQGVGYLVAKELAATHRVVLVDVQEDEVRRAATECGSDALAVPCDIIRQDEVDRAIAHVVERTGGIDVVVSGAGIGVGGSSRMLDPDVLAAMVNVNLTGNWRFVHACLPHVIERKGYVLGIASGAAIAPTPALGGYCASKAALEMLLEVLRLEVAHLGVDVGIAYFMFMDTQMVRLARHYVPAFKHTVELQPGPMHTIYPPEDAAQAVVKAIRGRKHHTFAPSYLREISATRMALRTRPGSMAARKHAAEIDELTATSVAERGPFAGAMVPTVACEVAARSVGRELDMTADEPLDPSPAPP
jgi:NAD(P)-dependent dehydrogenase (short-subunit alcohol dehydrogenase family)